MLPWSVIPIAGWPSATAAATTSCTRAAPSSMENSVWRCRCVNESPTAVPFRSCPQPCGELHPCDFRSSRYRGSGGVALRGLPLLAAHEVARRREQQDQHPEHADLRQGGLEGGVVEAVLLLGLEGDDDDLLD